MVPHDVLWRYLAGVESGAFDKDLAPDEREAVVHLLTLGVRILADFGGTSAWDLTRHLHDCYQTPEVNARVRQIIEGCYAS